MINTPEQKTVNNDDQKSNQNKELIPKKNCFQIYIIISLIITFTLSFIIIGFGIYVLISIQNFFKNSTFSQSLVYGLLFLSLGVLLLVNSIFGFYKNKSNSKWIGLIFIVTSILLAIVFLGSGFGLLIIKLKFYSDIEFSKCQNTGNTITEFLYRTEQAYIFAQNTLCTRKCRCFMQSESIDKWASKVLTDQVMTNARGEYAIQTQQCKDFDTQYSEIAKWLNIIEDTFECSGICVNQQLYYFSDVSKNQPLKTCKKKILSFIDDYGLVVYVITIGLGVYLTINAIASICLYCSQKQKGVSKYERTAAY